MEIQWLLATIVVLGAMLLTLWAGPHEGGKTVQWPAGPSKLPIIGNLHQLSKGGELLHLTLSKLAQKHGPMMTVWLGGWKPTIVVSNQELAWEVLVTKAPDFASRTLPDISKLVSADWQTLATSAFGPHWYSLRKGAQSSALNPLNISAQTHLQESDAKSLVQRLGLEALETRGAVRPLMHLRRTTLKLVARLCFGLEFDNEEFFDRMDAVIEDTVRLTGIVRLVDVFPCVRFIPGLGLPLKQAYELKRRIEELVRPCLSRSTPNTYLHFLLSQDFAEQVVIFNIFEFFLLAVDSTSNCVAWALGFLICNPDIQEKLYSEIRSTTVEGVKVDDVSKMQYLHAIVKETTRMKPIAPVGVPHKAVKDCNLMGSRIMEGTSVIVNIYNVLYDPAVWEEPHRFMPERFMACYGNDGGGDVAAARLRAMERSFLSFGAGRRACAAIEMAKLHVALCLANLVSAYHWSAIDGVLPDMSEDLTFVLRMKTPLAAHVHPRCP